MKTCSFSSH